MFLLMSRVDYDDFNSGPFEYEAASLDVDKLKALAFDTLGDEADGADNPRDDIEPLEWKPWPSSSSPGLRAQSEQYSIEFTITSLQVL